MYPKQRRQFIPHDVIKFVGIVEKLIFFMVTHDNGRKFLADFSKLLLSDAENLFYSSHAVQHLLRPVLTKGHHALLKGRILDGIGI